MKELRKLLGELKPESTKKEVVQRFEKIADELFNKYIIVTSNGNFEFSEIEFYFKNSNHQDGSVHQHNLSAGRWRGHLSGLDITFEGGADSYGGILIRSIKRIGVPKPFINGPYAVLYNLMLDHDIESDIKLKITKKGNESNEKKKLATKKRYGLGKNAEDDFKLAPYCFYVSDDYEHWNSGYKSRLKTDSNK